MSALLVLAVYAVGCGLALAAAKFEGAFVRADAAATYQRQRADGLSFDFLRAQEEVAHLASRVGALTKQMTGGRSRFAYRADFRVDELPHRLETLITLDVVPERERLVMQCGHGDSELEMSRLRISMLETMQSVIEHRLSAERDNLVRAA